MSYLLEREIEDRVTRYRTEAAASRAVPREGFRHRLASTLHRLADRLDDRAMSNRFAGEGQGIVLQGRNR